MRVEAARLREKIRQYYEADGRGDPIRIDLPKGTYAPQIEFRQATTRNNDAHDELLRGLKRFWCYTRESCAEAQHHFAQAAILDPEYAAAHAWLARTYHWQACMNWVPNSKSTMDLAIKHARRAVELDDQSSLAHAILGWVQLFLGDVENAVSAGRRACAVDPNSADAKLFLSLILASTGHSAEALRHIETAMLLHPHPSSFYFEALGLCYFALADYDRAIAAFLRGIEINSPMACAGAPRPHRR